MKFYCDSCGAKYAISDDKIRGKILKVRCKKCTHVITVREPHAPAQAAPALAQAPQANAIAWFYAINGQSFGPFDQNTLVGMYHRAEVPDASYVWNETFSAWKPVFEVEPFASAVAAAQAIRPVARTIGVSGAMEAIKISDHQPPEDEQEGVVPERKPEPARPNPFAAKPAQTPAAAKPAASPEPKNELSGRLGQLRDRLNASPTPEAKGKPANPFAPDPQEDLDADATRDDLFVQPDPFKAAGISVASPSSPFRTHEVDSEAVLDELSAPQDEAPDFSMGIGLGAPSIADQELAAHQDIFAGIEANDESSIDFSAIESPAFAESPFVPSSKKEESFQASNSLLIQLDEIKKQGRSKRALIGGGIGIVLALVLAGGGYIWSQNRDVKLVVESTGIDEEHKGELVIPKYSQNELTTFGGEEVLNVSADAAEPDEGTNPEPPVEQPAAKTTKPVELAHNGVGNPPTKPKIDFKINIERGPDKLGDALSKAKAQGSNSSDNLSTGGNDPAKSVGAGSFKAPTIKTVPPPRLGTPTIRSAQFNRPDDKLDTNSKPSNTLAAGGLSKDELKEGFTKIRKSVSSCYQHHVRRGLPFESPKIKVQVEIQGSGKVASVKFTPSDLSFSEFGRCMDSRRGSWSFREYGGQPIRVEHTYVLQ